MNKDSYKLKFQKLVDIIKKLRGPEGCPWDKKQTPEDVRTYLLEEVYEVIEAIDEQNFHKLKEELGDLLLLIIFLSDYSQEKNKFTLGEVLDEISKKLVKRHPHVFDNLKLNTPEEVIKNWNRLKQKEKKRSSFFEGIPKSSPALLRSYLLMKKAIRFHKIKEISSKDLIDHIKKDIDKISNEEILAKVLLNITRYAVRLDINPESALLKYLEKYSKEFISEDD